MSIFEPFLDDFWASKIRHGVRSLHCIFTGFLCDTCFRCFGRVRIFGLGVVGYTSLHNTRLAGMHGPGSVALHINDTNRPGSLSSGMFGDPGVEVHSYDGPEVIFYLASHMYYTVRILYSIDKSINTTMCPKIIGLNMHCLSRLFCEADIILSIFTFTCN